jgi:ubiquinone/menaquinone biosynthesis C-methylase UbiE
VVNEMIRVCKPGGQILIGDLNDADKIGLYNAMREKENRNKKHITKETLLVHLFFDKEFFIKIAKEKKYKFK